MQKMEKVKGTIMQNMEKVKGTVMQKMEANISSKETHQKRAIGTCYYICECLFIIHIEIIYNYYPFKIGGTYPKCNVM